MHTHGGSDPDKDVAVVRVSADGYQNQAYKDDGELGLDTKKPPRELTDEEAEQQGKFKLSRKEKWRILKNVTAVSSAFMIQFTAFQGKEI